MASFLIFLLLSAYYSAASTAQQSPSNISLGSSLTPSSNSSWPSPSGLYAFGFFQQGNGYAVGIFLAGIPQRTVVWTANRDGPIFPIGVTLVLSSDGRLILRQTQGQDIDIAKSPGIYSASMLDTGNFVLYNSARNIIWQSFEHPTNTLLPGQQLSAGQELISDASETNSSRGIFRLKMQADGNLAQYPVGAPDSAFPYAYWTSRTEGQGPNVTLKLEDNGHLYLLMSNGSKLNQTDGYPTNRTIYLARVDADGIFRLYSHSLDRGNWSIRWESSADKCDPKGLCGVNSFCTLIDTAADCRCLPGFVPINQDRSSGCERNFTAESCKSLNGSVKYEISTLDNMQWENNPYEVLVAATQEDCEDACSQDCNCEAAFFRDLECRKQKLPLRYGKRTADSTIALVKVGIPLPFTKNIPSNLPKTTKKEVRLDILIIGISFTAFGALISVLAGVYVHRKRLWAYKNINREENVKLIENVAPRAFTFAELEKATKYFQEELGRGAFGTVYKGILPNSQKEVAVKRLEKVLEDGETEFQNEILAIGKTHHRNLVRLLGFCIDGPNRLLVYEYMSNGSLANILFMLEKKLSWEYRMEIASQISRGILYLHEECETQIIHCDIKPQNILIDENGCAKISDFGLAKLLKNDQSKTYTGIRGTKGYVAPEWHRKLPVTVKVDIYSFGIVLLEIICCRKSVDWSLPDDQAVLEEWAYDCFVAKGLHKLVSDEEVDMRKLERVIKIAMWCVQDEPALRPSMRKVLLMLEGTVDIPEPPSPTSFLSSSVV